MSTIKKVIRKPYLAIQRFDIALQNRFPLLKRFNKVSERLPIVTIFLVIFMSLPAAAMTYIATSQQADEPQQSQQVVAEQNVLFLAVDDLKDWVGPDKPDWLKTPNIDALIADSTYFENAQSTGAQCNPSRVSIWTSLRPSSTGLQDNMHDVITAEGKSVKNSWRSWFRDPSSEAYENYGEAAGSITTLFDQFHDNGYYVGATGKLYHQNQQAEEEVWDAYYPVYPLVPTAPLMNIPGADDYGAVEDYILPNGNMATEADLADTKTTDNTITILNDLPVDQPFFVATGFWRPHNPNYVPQKYIDMYKDASVGSYTFGSAADVIPYKVDDQADVPNPIADFRNQYVQKYVIDDPNNPDSWSDLVAHYAASITYVDAEIGRIIADLKDKSLYDTTNIVLWSDHGYSLGEKGHVRKKNLWGETSNIPLIIRAPGITEPGTISSRMVTSVDIFPTLIDLVGLQMPTDVPRDGRSFSRLIRDPGDNWPWLAHMELKSTEPWQSRGGRQQALSLRSEEGDTYMAHFFTDTGTLDIQEELYDINNDPNEWNNLLYDQSNITQEVQTKAERYRAIAEKSLGPQSPPMINDSTIDLNSTQNDTTFTIEADDPDGDYLEFYVESTPDVGKLYSNDTELQEGDRIPNNPGMSATLTYRIPDDQRGGTLNEQFQIRSYDGIDSAQGTISVNAMSSLVLECKPNRLFTLRGNATNSGMVLHRVDVGTEGSTFTQIALSQEIPYGTNAIGYNSVDQSFYGVRSFKPNTGVTDPSRILVAMRKNGLYEEVANIDQMLEDAGYPELSSRSEASKRFNVVPLVSGDVYNNTYYGVINTNTYLDNPPVDTVHEAYLISLDLSSVSSVVVTPIKYSNYFVQSSPEGTGDPYFGDIAIHPYEGVAYYFDRLALQFGKVNLDTGRATLYGNTYDPTAQPIIGGALMFSEEGRFYAYGGNASTETKSLDTLYEVDQATGQISIITVSDPADQADGAGCFTFVDNNDNGDGVTPPPPIISQPGQFTCDTNQIFLTRGTVAEGSMSLDVITLADGTATISNLANGVIPYRTNATGYNPKDKFVYGVTFSTNRPNDPESGKRIVQVQKTGEVNTVLDLDNALVAKGYPQLSTTNEASNVYRLIAAAAGAIYENNYYIVLSSATTGSLGNKNSVYESHLLRINLATFELEEVTLMTYSNFVAGETGRVGIGGPLMGDLVMHPTTGETYAYDRISEQLTTVDLKTGVVTVFGPDHRDDSSDFIGGSAMFDGSGNLYIIGANNDTVTTAMDTIYQVSLPAGNLTEILGNQNSEIADGASCS